MAGARTTWIAEQLAEVSKSTTGYTDVVALTHTPSANASVLYVVSFVCQPGSASSDIQLRVLHDTAAADRAVWNIEAKDTGDWQGAACAFVEAYGASPGSQTVSLEYAAETAGVTQRVKSARLWALELVSADKFSAGSSSATTNSSTSTYVDAASSAITFTPDSSGDYYILVSWEWSNSTTSSGCDIVIDVDGTDEQSYQSSVKDTSNFLPGTQLLKKTLSAASHTIKVQGRIVGSATLSMRRARVTCLRADEFLNSYFSEDRTRASGTQATYQDELSYAPTIAAAVKHAVIGHCWIDNQSDTLSSQGRFTDGTTDYLEIIKENEVTSDPNHHPLFAAAEATLSAGSGVTWKSQRRSETTSHTTGIDESAILILQIGTAGTTYSEAFSLAASEAVSASGVVVMAPAIALPAAAGSVAVPVLSAFETLSFDAALEAEVSPAGSDFNATITLPTGETLTAAAGIAFDKDVALAATATLVALGGLSLDDAVSLAAGLMLADAITLTVNATAVLGATAGAATGGLLIASPSVTIGMIAGTTVSGTLIAEIAAALDALTGLGDAAQREAYAAIGLAAYGGLTEIDRLDASAALALGAGATSAAFGRLEIAMAASLGGAVMIGATSILTGAIVPGTIAALDALAGSLDVTLEEVTALGIGDARAGGATVDDGASADLGARDDAVTDVAISDGA